MTKTIDEELLADVVLAVGVLKGKVELVVIIKKLEAFVGASSGTSMRSTSTKDINLNQR